MANFVDFVADASQDPKKGKEFIDKLRVATADELVKWFAGRGYDIPLSECEKLVNNKTNIVDIKNVATRESY